MNEPSPKLAAQETGSGAFSRGRDSSEGLLARIRIYLLSLAAWALMTLLAKTLRWEFKCRVDADTLLEREGPKIFAFWHGHQLLLPWAWYVFRRSPALTRFCMLISSHADGRIIAGVCARQGMCSAAGSSSRGGGAAVRILLEELKEGRHIGITPDGPKGPIHKAKLGVVELGRLSQKPIHAVAVSAKSAWRFRSWDGMFLPKPFSKVVVSVSEPTIIGVEQDQEAARAEIEALLNRNAAEAQNV